VSGFCAFFVNDVMYGKCLEYLDSNLGCGEMLWKSDGWVGFCFGIGLWKSWLMQSRLPKIKKDTWEGVYYRGLLVVQLCIAI
jgi:hypothetical protein